MVTKMKLEGFEHTENHYEFDIEGEKFYRITKEGNRIKSTDEFEIVDGKITINYMEYSGIYSTYIEQIFEKTS